MIPHTETSIPRAEDVRLALSVPPDKEAVYTSVMSEALEALNHDSEIGLYRVRQTRPIVTDADAGVPSKEQIVWSLSVVTPNDLLVKSVLWGYLMMRIAGTHLSAEERDAITDIMEQMKPCIRQSRPTPTPTQSVHTKV